MWPRQESDLDQELRSLLFYPLNYEAGDILPRNSATGESSLCVLL